MAQAYPLQWPEGWKRTDRRIFGKFKQTNTSAVQHLREEIQRLGGSSIVISSNLPLKVDGTPRMDREPVDPGVAVYFYRNEKQVVFACDQYDYLRDNAYAIAKTIEAMRGIERWGASEMMERVFTGFKALPDQASEGEDCWKILELPPMSTADLVKLKHRDLIRKLHAKNSASEEFSRVNVARDAALRALEAAR